MKKHVPNFLTICNLSCGCLGVVFAFNKDLPMAAGMMWAGAVFDFFDGFAARLLKTFSPLGKELDSLADMITFCFLPSVILFVMSGKVTDSAFLPYLAFIVAIFGALRLAKFNIDERQSDTFHGLPSPASALAISALPFVKSPLISNPYVLLGIGILLSVLMVSDMKMMSLKFKDFTFKNNFPRYLLILAFILLFIWLKFIAFPIIIIFYVFLSYTIQLSK